MTTDVHPTRQVVGLVRGFQPRSDLPIWEQEPAFLPLPLGHPWPSNPRSTYPCGDPRVCWAKSIGLRDPNPTIATHFPNHSKSPLRKHLSKPLPAKSSMTSGSNAGCKAFHPWTWPLAISIPECGKHRAATSIHPPIHFAQPTMCPGIESEVAP